MWTLGLQKKGPRGTYLTYAGATFAYLVVLALQTWYHWDSILKGPDRKFVSGFLGLAVVTALVKTAADIAQRRSAFALDARKSRQYATLRVFLTTIFLVAVWLWLDFETPAFGSEQSMIGTVTGALLFLFGSLIFEKTQPTDLQPNPNQPSINA